MNQEPQGLLIIRAWVEEGTAEPLRARIWTTTGSLRTGEVSYAVAGPENILQTVQGWIGELLAPDPDGTDRPP